MYLWVSLTIFPLNAPHNPRFELNNTSVVCIFSSFFAVTGFKKRYSGSVAGSSSVARRRCIISHKCVQYGRLAMAKETALRIFAAETNSIAFVIFLVFLMD